MFCRLLIYAYTKYIRTMSYFDWVPQANICSFIYLSIHVCFPSWFINSFKFCIQSAFIYPFDICFIPMFFFSDMFVSSHLHCSSSSWLVVWDSFFFLLINYIQLVSSFPNVYKILAQVVPMVSRVQEMKYFGPNLWTEIVTTVARRAGGAKKTLTVGSQCFLIPYLLFLLNPSKWVETSRNWDDVYPFRTLVTYGL